MQIQVSVYLWDGRKANGTEEESSRSGVNLSKCLDCLELSTDTQSFVILFFLFFVVVGF